MINPKETLNHLIHGKNQGKPQSNVPKEEEDNPYSVESDNLAIPEVHTKDHDEKLRKREAEQNQSNKKEDVVFDTLAMPEIHIRN